MNETQGLVEVIDALWGGAVTAMALQLFNSATIPATAIDQALEFRRLAEALANGDLVLAPAGNAEAKRNE